MSHLIPAHDGRKTALATGAWTLLVFACLACIVWVAIAQPVLGGVFAILGVAAAALMGISISTAAATR